MKKIFTPLFVLAVSAAMSQTVFWTEDFGTGCNRGQLASAYTGTNGAWSVTNTGANQPYANIWFVSATSAGTTVNQCADDCQFSNTTNQTLHVGNPLITVFSTTVLADCTATYLTGVFCGFGYCSTTDKRVESPAINCSNRNTITCSFLYYENGETTNDDATMWYYDGTTWSSLNALAKTPLGNCSPRGQWTAITVNLPASANNNPNVKIGYRWINNDDGVGNDPSFSVDDITLSGFITIGYDDDPFRMLNLWSDQTNIYLRGAGMRLRAVYNITGQQVPFLSEGDHYLVNAPPGVYFAEVENGNDRTVRKVILH